MIHQDGPKKAPTLILDRNEKGRRAWIRHFKNGKFDNYVVYWYDDNGKRQQQKYADEATARAKVKTLFDGFFAIGGNQPAKLPNGFLFQAERLCEIAKKHDMGLDALTVAIDRAYTRLGKIGGSIEDAIDLYVETTHLHESVIAIPFPDAVKIIVEDLVKSNGGKALDPSGRRIVSVATTAADMIKIYTCNVTKNDLVEVLMGMEGVESYYTFRDYLAAMRYFCRAMADKGYFIRKAPLPTEDMPLGKMWDQFLLTHPDVKKKVEKSLDGEVKETYSVAIMKSCLDTFKKAIQDSPTPEKARDEVGFLVILAIRVFTGMRVKEIYKLLKFGEEYFDFENRWIHVPAKVSKTKQERTILIWDVLMSYLTSEGIAAASDLAHRQVYEFFSANFRERIKATPNLKFVRNGMRHLAASAIFRLTKCKELLVDTEGHSIEMYLKFYARYISFEDTISLFQCFYDENDPRAKLDPRALFQRPERIEYPALDVVKQYVPKRPLRIAKLETPLAVAA